MSDINLDFTVSNNQISFTVEPNEITITPTDVQLNILAGGIAIPSAPGNSIQYNKNNQFAGDANLTYDDATHTLSTTNLNVTGNASLTASVSNIHITGGTNGYVLQTDGLGNLTWAAAGGAGNGNPGGSNTQIQYNDNGLFGGNVGFTFDKTTGQVSLPANLSIAGNVTSNLTVTGLTSIQEAKEKVTANSTGSTGTVQFDVLTQAILFKTANATSNFTLNIRGNSSTTLNSVMSSNESMTLRFVNTNGVTGYYANVIQIDGNTITPQWVYPIGAPTSGLASAKDVYDFNIIKTATNTYTVFASKTGYQ